MTFIAKHLYLNFAACIFLVASSDFNWPAQAVAQLLRGSY